MGRFARFALQTPAVLFLTLAIGCGGGPSTPAVVGKYVMESDPKQGVDFSHNYIELKSDGKFFWQGGHDATVGKYEIEGNQITFTTNGGEAERGKIDGKTIVFNRNKRYTKP